ncbi:hypothetical protein POM88_019902 [Heracleum sosnowskyi]|uniref:DUF4220 domain-containing protein n=1 Tax=Heracleum sosnowskyi TaxID=360622 RepID=A0AAD8ICT9_9APIA|nr:hypothetical protein POM88_019902 [Heracleum sosnowskyi]
MSIPTLHRFRLDDLFDEWELRACILLSLFLQIFLIVAGTFRRLASHKWIFILLWLAYLLAEITAIFGLGLIVSRQSLFSKYCNEDEGNSCYNDHLHIYWAPFLLVHLGGPDTITAFAPEDNELWLRHLFSLASQVIAVAYAFYQSLQTNHQLRIPTLLMLLCGIIKCTERTRALYYGSAKSFRNSVLPGPDMHANNIKKKESKVLIKMNGDALSHLQVLQYAFVYFTAFKGLVVDLILSIDERNQSREFFLATSFEVAFRLVEVELNYLYDVLFTKLPVLHHKFGYWCRTLSFMAVVASLALFHFVVKRDYYSPLDVVITYILLIGAIVLDVISFFMLLFCDWTVVKLRPLSDANSIDKPWKHKFVDWILLVNNTRSVFLDWLLGFVGDRDPSASKFTDSRWAESLSTFNLIYYCLHRCSKGRESFYDYFGLLTFLNEFWYVKPHPLTHYLIDFIFNELRMKSEIAGSLATAKKICSSKGEWIFENEGEFTFLPFVSGFNYDEILLLWHIATEICYNDSQDQLTINLEKRDTAKQLSDYMLYLMVMKPDMMSAVSSVGDIKFRDTCTKVSKLFDTELPELKRRKYCFFGRESEKEKETLQRRACERLLSINGEVKPVTVQTSRNELLLFNASALAKELKQVFPSDKKWLIISRLWVELLSYAASHIRSSAHAEQLSIGGELITIVWLLMAHFGLGNQFEIIPGTKDDD